MFGNIGDYQTEADIEMDGVIIPFKKGRSITIRRAGGSNQAYTDYAAMRFKETKRQTKTGDVEEDVAREVMYDIYATKVVIGWAGWKDKEGKDIPFTKQNCMKLFQESREIYAIIFEEAQNLDNFRSEEIFNSGNV